MRPVWRSGYWKAVEDLRANWGKDHEWTPQMPAKQRDAVQGLEEGCDPHVQLGRIIDFEET